MPWTVGDVDKHKKGLSAEEKKKWVSIANAVLKTCMDGGGEQGDCEAEAIKTANSKTREIEREDKIPEYFWDEAVGRYRDEGGKFVAETFVREQVENSIAVASELIKTVKDSWHDTVREQLKEEYIRQYALGRGGVEQMTQQDWGSVGGMLAEQYKYLKDFAAVRDTLSEEEVAQRLALYMNSSREAYERANFRVVEETGLLDEVEWEVVGDETSCEDCLGYGAMGWQKVDESPFPFPGDGSTRCLTNCRCKLGYRNSKEPND